MNVQDIKSTIQQHKEKLRSFGLRRVGVLDFVPAKKTYRNFLRGTEYLETLLKRPVDPVTPQGVSPYIKPYIDRAVTYVQITD